MVARPGDDGARGIWVALVGTRNVEWRVRNGQLGVGRGPPTAGPSTPLRTSPSTQLRQAGTGSRATQIDIRRISSVLEALNSSQGPSTPRPDPFRPGRNLG